MSVNTVISGFVSITGITTRTGVVPKTNNIIFEFSGKYEFLSNFYPSKIVYEERLYPTVEHAFAASKTLDAAIRDIIANAETPGKAKILGRRIRLRPFWDEIKQTPMLDCLRAKFAVGSPLARRLLRTAPKYLIEGNTWHDNYWGVCVCVRCKNGPKAKNFLGKLLMRVRFELLREDKEVKMAFNKAYTELKPDTVKDELWIMLNEPSRRTRASSK